MLVLYIKLIYLLSCVLFLPAKNDNNNNKKNLRITVKLWLISLILDV